MSADYTQIQTAMQWLFVELHDHFARTRDFGLLHEFISFLDGFERSELLKLLFWAALEERDWELAEKCAGDGFQIVTADYADSGSLHHVISMVGGRTDIVEWLLRHGAALEQPKACSGLTPLMSASLHGFLDTADTLIRAGAELNARTLIDEEMTPLMFSAIAGHESMATLLLDSGANPTLLSRSGLDAAQIAEMHDCESVAALIRKAISGWQSKKSGLSSF